MPKNDSEDKAQGMCYGSGIMSPGHGLAEINFIRKMGYCHNSKKNDSNGRTAWLLYNASSFQEFSLKRIHFLTFLLILLINSFEILL